MNIKDIKPDLTIKRAYFSDCTLGRMISLSGKSVFTLELPYLGNAEEQSCIEPGLYPYRKAISPRTGEMVIWIDEVEGRTNIQIHPANKVDDILGCIAPGMSIADHWEDGVPDTLDSAVALNKIMSQIPDTGYIYITDSPKPGKYVYEE